MCYLYVQRGGATVALPATPASVTCYLVWRQSLNEVACLRWRSLETLHVSPESHGTSVLINVTDAGSGVYIPSSGTNGVGCILSWAVSQAQPSQVQLTETHVGGERSNCRRKIGFGSTVFSTAVYHSSKGLIVLAADGILYSLLPLDQANQQSLLGALTVSSTDLKREIERIGAPSSLGLVDVSQNPAEQHVCIGGQTGGLLLVPPGCFDAQVHAKPYELQHRPSGYRALFAKGTTSAVTWTGLLGAFAPGILCALHSDYTLCFWSVKTRQRLLAEILLQQSGQKGHMTPACVGSVCSPQGHLRLVVHLRPNTKGYFQPQTVACSMDLQMPQEGSLQVVNMRERMLEQDDLHIKTVLMHSYTSNAPSTPTWLLSSSPSLRAITSNVSGQPHSESAQTVLIEKQGVDTGHGHISLQARSESTLLCSCTSHHPVYVVHMLVREVQPQLRCNCVLGGASRLLTLFGSWYVSASIEAAHVGILQTVPSLAIAPFCDIV